METEVSLNHMTLQGSAPSARLSLLLKALRSLAADRNLNRAEFQAYAANEALRSPSVAQELESRLCPDYPYTARKNPAVLTPETQDKAEKYFAERFSRMNDGVLILCGDLEEEVTKKLLCRYLGGFRTLRGGVARRPVELLTRSGVSTFTAPGPQPGLYLLLDTEYALTAEHYYTLGLALEALRKQLVEHLSGSGYRFEFQAGFMAQPQERVRLQINCTPIPEENLPADVPDLSAENVLTAVRAALRSAALSPVEEVDLAAWKARMSANTRDGLQDSASFVATLLARYAHNKDLTSRYAQCIAGVSAADVQALLGQLAAGGRVEWIVP